MSREERPPIYTCDQCQRTDDGEVIRLGVDRPDQGVMPRGWVTLEGRVRREGGGKPQHVKGHFCSASCAAERIDEFVRGDR